MIRRVGAIFFVILFALGTATTLFIFQPSAASTGTTTTNVPLATAPDAGNIIQLTPNPAAQSTDTTNSDQINQLVKQAQDAATAGKWPDAISYYKAALGLTSGNASIEYDLGKAYIQTKDYPSAVEHLQRSVELNPSATFAGDATNLINTYKAQATAGASQATPGGTTAPAAATAASTPQP